MRQNTRREFMTSAGAALAGTAVLRAARSAKAAPNDRVRHAVIGLGSQGRRHAKAFAACADCEIVALCDVDPERRAYVAKELGNPPSLDVVEDFRAVLDRDDIDSVSVATPDHWHTPVALAALAAGKHVYVEKPCSHTVHEGVLLAAAAKGSGKCVQHGTQGRSGEGIRDAVQFMGDGNLGKVRLAKAINHQLRGAIGRAPETDPPPGVNYDLWTGPAPAHPFTRNRWHYNWHWFWDYGAGDLGNDGIHQVDEARWGLGVQLPNAVTASGGQLFYDDDHETPDTQIITYEYDDCYLMYEMRLWTDYKLEGHDNGVIFYGDKGTLEMGRRGCEVTFKDGETKSIGGGADFDGNVRNFLDAVKANDPGRLNAPISEGATTATLCNLGNIATRVGRRLRLDAETLTCIDDPEATALFTKEYRKGYELPTIA